MALSLKVNEMKIMPRGGEIMVETDYRTLNALIDEVLVRAPMLPEGSTFVLPSFDCGNARYVQEYCRSQGWECRYYPLTEKFWDAVEEHKEIVHRFYVGKLDASAVDIPID